jgi:hypothetical protein
VNSWLIFILFGVKIFIENTKGVWYNIDNWGRPPKRGCGEPHATEQQFQESDHFDHKKVQNDKIPRKRGAKHI